MACEINYNGNSIILNENESVLEGCERHGYDVSSSCRAGVCQCCLMKAKNGVAPKKSQNGLKDDLVLSGHFLSCICFPQEFLACELASVSGFKGQIQIRHIKSIGKNIVEIRFEKPKDFQFSPGQFATFHLGEKVARSYSLIPSRDDLDEFSIHVKKVPNGKMSAWFHDVANSKDTLVVEGPKGECFYYPDRINESLLLVGTGTGMAPLYAIASDAISKGHVGPIRIFQGALVEGDLYFCKEFYGLMKKPGNIEYQQCVLSGKGTDGVLMGDICDYAVAACKSLVGARAYLCGSPEIVISLKKKLFLEGLSLKNIHSDPFVGTSL